MESEKRKALLDESELESVVGGYTEEEITEKITKLWSIVPEDIRNELIDTMQKNGKKAAYYECLRIAKNKKLDWMTPMAELFR